MGFYISKPVQIEARQIGNDYDEDLVTMRWCGGRMPHPDELENNPDLLFLVQTLEGLMSANSGDWIIKGLIGEFYPCKNEVFIAKYQEVTE
jgi:hypothetical protein